MEHTRTFVLEAPKKGSAKYTEQPETGKLPISGTFYYQRPAMTDAMNPPKKLRITVEEVE